MQFTIWLTELSEAMPALPPPFHQHLYPHARRSGKIGLIIALMLILNTTVLAFYQMQPALDPGLAGVQQAGLIKPINQQQTLENGITITLDWVYVDVTRIAAQYTVAGLDPADLQWNQVSPDGEYLFPDMTLTAGDGSVFSFANGSADPDPENGRLIVHTGFYTQAFRPAADGQMQLVNDYFRSVYPNLPEQIALTAAISLNRSIAPMMAEPDDLIGMATFDVTVPIYGSRTVTPMQTTAADGIRLTLEEVRVTPSMLEMRVCYELPDVGDWQPGQVIATINGQPALMSGMGMDGRPDPADTFRCQNISFYAFVPPDAVTVTLQVDYLIVSEPETVDFWEQVRDRLAEHEVIINLTLANGTYYEVASLPDGMTDEAFGQLLSEIKQDLRRKAGGQWQFEVHIPAAS